MGAANRSRFRRLHLGYYSRFLFLDFYVSEAMWLIEVKDFPAVVTMDVQGKSLHAEIYKRSEASGPVGVKVAAV